MTLLGLPFLRTSSTPPSIAVQTAPEMSLAELPPGKCAQVAGFYTGISPDRRAQLQSYGIIPGYPIQVVQHSPVTIAQVENIELALEQDLARLVRVNI